MSLMGKVAVVTGSAAGIGKAVAVRYAAEGAKVVINSRTSVDEGQAIVSQIVGDGGVATYCKADVTEESDVDHLFSHTIDAYGTVDILVNNAGSPMASPFESLDKTAWLQAINANLTSTVLCSSRVASIMKNNGGGSIINTSSIRGIDHAGRAPLLGYSAAKAGVNSVTCTLAKELAPNIFVNAIAPGFVHTGYMDNVSDELKQAWLEGIPIARFIKPEELAEAFVFLAKSKIMTGTVWVIDGGFTLKLA